MTDRMVLERDRLRHWDRARTQVIQGPWGMVSRIYLDHLADVRVAKGETPLPAPAFIGEKP